MPSPGDIYQVVDHLFVSHGQSSTQCKDRLDEERDESGDSNGYCSRHLKGRSSRLDWNTSGCAGGNHSSGANGGSGVGTNGGRSRVHRVDNSRGVGSAATRRISLGVDDLRGIGRTLSCRASSRCRGHCRHSSLGDDTRRCGSDGGSRSQGGSVGRGSDNAHGLKSASHAIGGSTVFSRRTLWAAVRFTSRIRCAVVASIARVSAAVGAARLCIGSVITVNQVVGRVALLVSSTASLGARVARSTSSRVGVISGTCLATHENILYGHLCQRLVWLLDALGDSDLARKGGESNSREQHFDVASCILSLTNKCILRCRSGSCKRQNRQVVREEGVTDCKKQQEENECIFPKGVTGERV